MSSPAVSAAGVGEFGGGGGRFTTKLGKLNGGDESGPAVLLVVPRKPQQDEIIQLPWHSCGSLALCFCWRISCSHLHRADQAAVDALQVSG